MSSVFSLGFPPVGYIHEKCNECAIRTVLLSAVESYPRIDPRRYSIYNSFRVDHNGLHLRGGGQNVGGLRYRRSRTRRRTHRDSRLTFHDASPERESSDDLPVARGRATPSNLQQSLPAHVPASVSPSGGGGWPSPERPLVVPVRGRDKSSLSAPLRLTHGLDDPAGVRSDVDAFASRMGLAVTW